MISDDDNDEAGQEDCDFSDNTISRFSLTYRNFSQIEIFFVARKPGD